MKVQFIHKDEIKINPDTGNYENFSISFETKHTFDYSLDAQELCNEDYNQNQARSGSLSFPDIEEFQWIRDNITNFTGENWISIGSSRFSVYCIRILDEENTLFFGFIEFDSKKISLKSTKISLKLKDISALVAETLDTKIPVLYPTSDFTATKDDGGHWVITLPSDIDMPFILWSEAVLPYQSMVNIIFDDNSWTSVGISAIDGNTLTLSYSSDAFVKISSWYTKSIISMTETFELIFNLMKSTYWDKGLSFCHDIGFKMAVSISQKFGNMQYDKKDITSDQYHWHTFINSFTPVAYYHEPDEPFLIHHHACDILLDTRNGVPSLIMYKYTTDSHWEHHPDTDDELVTIKSFSCIIWSITQKTLLTLVKNITLDSNTLITTADATYNSWVGADNPRPADVDRFTNNYTVVNTTDLYYLFNSDWDKLLNNDGFPVDTGDVLLKNTPDVLTKPKGLFCTLKAGFDRLVFNPGFYSLRDIYKVYSALNDITMFTLDGVFQFRTKQFLNGTEIKTINLGDLENGSFGPIPHTDLDLSCLDNLKGVSNNEETSTAYDNLKAELITSRKELYDNNFLDVKAETTQDYSLKLNDLVRLEPCPITMRSGEENNTLYLVSKLEKKDAWSKREAG